MTLLTQVQQMILFLYVILNLLDGNRGLVSYYKNLITSPPVSPVTRGGGIRKKKTKRRSKRRKSRKNIRRKTRKNTRRKTRKNTRRKNTRRKNTRRKNTSRRSKRSRRK